uniref:Uncharacterized protein n=1 Tax=Tetranychus urticae TaxID=32264 RepID=T1KWW1_TETUR
MNKIVFIALGGFGIVLALVSAILLGQWSNIIQKQVNKKLVISEKSEDYDKFVAPDVPIYLKFYLFDVKNPDEIMKGGKPKVEQKGPYSFLEKRVKEVESFSKDKVTYKEVKTYHFDPETSHKSVSLNDAFTHINVPWMTVMSASFHLPGAGQGNIFRQLIPLKVPSFKAPVQMFLKHTAGELLFDTYPIEFIGDINNLLAQIKQHQVNLTNFAYFMEKNATDEGRFVVNTGSKNSKNLLAIESWKGSNKVDFWVKDSKCNNIVGTDATGFAPGIKKNSKLEIFTTDLCRSFPLERLSESEVKGISTHRYVIPAQAFYGPDKNPENKCFCIAPDKKDCNHNGLLDISSCRQFAPLVASSPMFFQADDDLFTAIDGLHERKSELHQTYLDIEPITGKVLSAYKRLQISAHLKQDYCPVPTKANVYLPLLWVEEGFSIDDELADEFKSKVTAKINKAHKARKFIVFGLVLGLLLIVACLGLFFYNKFQSGR